MNAHQRIGGSAGQYLLQRAEVLEHFEGAGLNAFGAGAVKGVISLVDDAHGQSAPGQVDGQRGAHGACADDEDIDDGCRHGVIRSVYAAAKAARCSATSTGRS